MTMLVLDSAGARLAASFAPLADAQAARREARALLDDLGPAARLAARVEASEAGRVVYEWRALALLGGAR